jgi:putative addiction module killer protein
VEATPRELRFYKTADGKRPFLRWYEKLNSQLRIAVRQRLSRAEDGNFGDTKPLGDAVFELRIHIGKGHRIYYGLDGPRIVLLLTAGEKSTQERDIRNAKEYWNDYRSHESKERSSEQRF